MGEILYDKVIYLFYLCIKKEESFYYNLVTYKSISTFFHPNFEIICI